MTASDDIPDKLPTKSFASMTSHRSYVFYGRAGTGKTTLSVSFPGKVLLLDVQDKGSDSVADVDPKQGVGMSINEWDDLEMVYYYLKKNPDEYKTVVIDTVSQMQQLCIQKLLLDKKKDPKKAGDWGVMTKKDWGEVASIMKEWIIYYRDLTDLGLEVVFNAQDRVFNVDDEADAGTMLDPEVGPRLSPSIAAALNAAVNVIGNTFIREKLVLKEVNGKKKEIKRKVYCLRIGPDSRYVTKARKPKAVRLPDIIENPDYDEIISILKGE